MSAFRFTFFLFTICFMSPMIMLSQNIKYSENQLIGKENIKFYGDDYKLQKKAFVAFKKMQQAALKDSIQIKIVSSFRSFTQQKNIWNEKYLRYTKEGNTPIQAIEKIIEYSTIPGTSRHHWGTDIDIIDGGVIDPDDDVLQTQFFDEPNIYKPLKTWLDTNANTYGFYLVYTDDINRTGFKYEPWHYSYAPISKPMLEAYLELDINKLLKNNKLMGYKYLTKAFMETYKIRHFMGINNFLKPTTDEKN